MSENFEQDLTKATELEVDANVVNEAPAAEVTEPAAEEKVEVKEAVEEPTKEETAKVEGIIQDLIDSYLVCIGQMELYLDKKDYLDIPEASELSEAVNADEDLKLQEELEIKNSGDFNVEVKQELEKYLNYKI